MSDELASPSWDWGHQVGWTAICFVRGTVGACAAPDHSVETEDACLECTGVNEWGSKPQLLFRCSHLHTAWRVQQRLCPCKTGRRFTKNCRAQLPPALFLPVRTGKKTSVPNVAAAGQNPWIACMYAHKHTITPCDSTPPPSAHPTSCSFLHLHINILLLLYLPCFLLNHRWSIHRRPFISLIRSNNSTTAHCHSTSCLKKGGEETALICICVQLISAGAQVRGDNHY